MGSSTNVNHQSPEGPLCSWVPRASRNSHPWWIPKFQPLHQQFLNLVELGGSWCFHHGVRLVSATHCAKTLILKNFRLSVQAPLEVLALVVQQTPPVLECWTGTNPDFTHAFTSYRAPFASGILQTLPDWGCLQTWQGHGDIWGYDGFGFSMWRISTTEAHLIGMISARSTDTSWYSQRLHGGHFWKTGTGLAWYKFNAIYIYTYIHTYIHTCI